MKLENCKIGVRVKIKESSYWYDYGNRTNPSGVEGVIVKAASKICDWIKVDWDNDTFNIYKPEDLKMVKVRNTEADLKVGDKFSFNPNSEEPYWVYLGQRTHKYILWDITRECTTETVHTLNPDKPVRIFK